MQTFSSGFVQNRSRQSTFVTKFQPVCFREIRTEIVIVFERIDYRKCRLFTGLRLKSAGPRRKFVLRRVERRIKQKEFVEKFFDRRIRTRREINQRFRDRTNPGTVLTFLFRMFDEPLNRWKLASIDFHRNDDHPEQSVTVETLSFAEKIFLF